MRVNQGKIYLTTLFVFQQKFKYFDKIISRHFYLTINFTGITWFFNDTISFYEPCNYEIHHMLFNPRHYHLIDETFW